MSESATAASVASTEQALQKHKKWLVEEGEKLGEIARDHSKWKSQIRTLLEAARHETEPTVVTNLLGYQAAREKKWQTNDLDTKLGAALNRCVDEAGDDPALGMELIRHLLLYFLRAYTYRAARAEPAQEDEAGTSPQAEPSQGGGEA